MGISRMCMHRFAILAVLISLSVGLVVAANGGAQNNTSSNVGSNATKVSILSVNYTTTDQQVKIANIGASDVSFAGWKLMNKENLSYSFPTGFILKPGAFVRVHSMAGKK